MKDLLLKEFRLAMHPTVPLFLSLSAMLLIPNYPYYVVFFYTGLAIFFTCLSGRENQDVAFTASLPVPKAWIVGARLSFVLIVECAQLALALPFAFLRQTLIHKGNQVGMDANVAFFGLSLILLGLFNLSFFGVYYRDVSKVGKAFLVASSVQAACILVFEALTHIWPFAREVWDTPDPAHLGPKLILLGCGFLAFIGLNFITWRNSVKSFGRLDL